MQFVTPVLAAFLVSLVLVRLLASGWARQLATDIPNDRSLHDCPTSRLGGVGVMIAALGCWMAFAPGTLQPVAVLAGLLAAVFLIDDVRSLTVAVRFAVQAVAAIAYLAWQPAFGPLVLLPVVALGIMWSANLYNFMDGMNGLAGGMTVLGFGAYAAAAHLAGANDFATVCAIVAAAAAGFLVWNFDPARIFLGDAGSIALGFLAAALGLNGWQAGVWPFWFPFLVFSLFIIDSGLTLAKRILHGEAPWQAHKSHYYQRIVRMGWSHRDVALCAYVVMLLTGLTATAGRNAGPLTATALLIAWAVIYGGLIVVIDRTWRTSDARRDAVAARERGAA